MNTLYSELWASPLREEPEVEAAHRAALDRLMAEWAHPLVAGPVRCPSCGRVAGDHARGCDFSWLRLPALLNPA
jgi:hypothetical protein